MVFIISWQLFIFSQRNSFQQQLDDLKIHIFGPHPVDWIGSALNVKSE